MTFDLFDQNSWKPYLEEEEERLRNKLIKEIDQMMHRVKSLKEKLMVDNKFDSEDYRISEDLRRIYPKAYNLMEIEIQSQDEVLQKLLNNITSLEKTWNFPANKRKVYKDMLPMLKNLQQYLDPRGMFGSECNIHYVTTVSIKGNDAWYAYLAQVQCAKSWEDQAKELGYDNEPIDIENK
jgi:hypothetical protein